MRQISAVFLFITFLLYHVGYFAIYLTSWYQIEASWKEKIEENDLEGDYLQMESINLSIPYQQDQENFQAASGTVEIAGRIYRIVKQRYAKDTLHVVYVNDVDSENLKESFKKWLGSFSQKPVSEGNSKIVLSSLGKNYLPNFFEFDFSIIRAEQVPGSHYASFGFSPSLHPPFLPPEC